MNVTTLPTTSHNFTWTIDTLSAPGPWSSYLMDVAIVDEDNIWVMGNIETDSGRYNLAKWDGIFWTLSNVGPVGNNLYSIHVFTENDVWVSNICSPYHWDGSEWTYYRFSSGGVGVNACAGNAIWGSAPDNVYFVGKNGSIVHYDGSGFTRMESGTERDLLAISGLPVAGTWQPWVAGAVGPLVRYGDAWHVLGDPDQPGVITTAKGLADGAMLTMHWNGRRSRLTLHRPAPASLAVPMDSVAGYIASLAGLANNDIILAGTYNRLWHFNGLDVKSYPQLEGGGNFPGAAWQEATVCVVGYTGGSLPQAIVVRGEKIQ